MLHIVVCIKQVPDTTQVRVDPETNNLIREGIPSIVNPHDLHAIEEAVRLKARYGAKVTVITMGPPQAEEALKKALSFGADEAFLISDRTFAGADTWATTYTLAGAIEYLNKTEPVSLIICGKQTIDGDTAQVGPGIASRLKYSQLTYVDQVIDLNVSEPSITVRRKLEGAHEKVKSTLPALLTVVKEINEPHYAKLPDLIRALETKIPVLTAAMLGLKPELSGLKGSPTKVKKINPPPRRGGGEQIKPETPEQAAKILYDKLAAAGMFSLAHATGPGQIDGKAPGVARVIETKAGDPGLKNGVWVFIEHRDGHAVPVSWELLGAGRKLAQDLKSELGAVLCGHRVERLASEAIAYGADTVFIVDDPILAQYRTQPYNHAITALAKKYDPDVLLLGATTMGRDLASAVATEVGTGLTADCTGLAINEKRFLEQTRPAFGGNIMATILTEKGRPQMSTVRSRVMPLPTRDTTRQGKIVRESLGLSEENIRTKVLEYVLEDLAGTVNLDDTEVIVSGGRGMGTKENLNILEQLAGLLGGVLGASRAVVDAHWLPYEHQVGQTGKTVRPKLYIACGISGAVQHLVGMQTSDFIAAINTDPSAPIFSVANIGIVGNALEIVPKLCDLIRKNRS